MSSRILLTTRLHAMELDGLAGCEQKDLTALDPDDAVSFFHAEGVPGTRADIQEAYAPYGYHPLALRLLAGLIVKDKRQPGDIRVAARHRVIGELKGKEKHHILQVAYDALEPPRRDLLSRIAAFRSPINYESLAALNRFKDEKRFEQALDELIDRGVLLFDRGPARYDLHPVVRQYAYDRLTDKARVHARLRDYFEKIEAPGEHQIERRQDLDPVIELYHHTLKAHQYDEALDLFRDRLQYWLNFRFGAYQTCIELLKGLFSAGEDVPVRLKTDRAQAGALAMLADSYARSRQPGQAVALYLRAARIHKKSGNTMRVASDLGAAGFSQLRSAIFGKPTPTSGNKSD